MRAVAAADPAVEPAAGADPALASVVKRRVEPAEAQARAQVAQPAVLSAEPAERTADVAAPAEPVVPALAAAAPARPEQPEPAAGVLAPSRRSVAGRRNVHAA